MTHRSDSQISAEKTSDEGYALSKRGAFIVFFCETRSALVKRRKKHVCFATMQKFSVEALCRRVPLTSLYYFIDLLWIYTYFGLVSVSVLQPWNDLHRRNLPQFAIERYVSALLVLWHTHDIHMTYTWHTHDISIRHLDISISVRWLQLCARLGRLGRLGQVLCFQGLLHGNVPRCNLRHFLDVKHMLNRC